MIIFTFQAQRLFKQAAIGLPFLSCTVSHSKQPAVFSFPHLLFLPFQFCPLPRGQLFSLIRFFIYLVYIKPLVTINKQFNIDSFLDCGKVITGILAYARELLC